MTPDAIAHYHVVSKLGEGGMGTVYRAMDTKLNRDVAIKVLPDAFANDSDRLVRFVREAQVLAALNHPNIATIYGIEERAIVMELVEGPTLADRISQGPLPIEEALAIARQIGDALEAAHEKGVVHRDLKPANVKVTADGVVKVLDFGLAKLNDPTESGDPASAPTIVRGNSPTLAGVIMGTAGYMAPEQARGLSVDKRADIWAFGVVLYEMLTGRDLYGGGETVADSLAAVIHKEPDWTALPTNTPQGVKRLLQGCLEKDRKKRLRDIGDAWRLLEEPAVAPRRSSLWPMLAAGAALLYATGLSFFHFRETAPPERVIRYTIPLPAKSRIHTFALSPDGRFVAMALLSEGKRQIWLRQLDTLTQAPLKGTDDASYPFWSPDSRSIGFFSEDKLKRIAVDGGPAQTLCDARYARGGTWNADGLVVFSAGGELRRVAAMGGVATPTTTRVKGTFHYYPVFLPDGRRFLFEAWSTADDKAGIFAGSLDSSEARRILPDQSAVAWQPPPAGRKNGLLLFLREGTLMAQPLHPRTLEPTGDLFPVVDNVRTGRQKDGTLMASVSADGVQVYMSNAGHGLWQLTWYDRAGKPLSNVGEPGEAWAVALSHDGKFVAYSKFSGPKDLHIWLHDLSRGIDTRLTFDNFSNTNPFWSSDNRRILFGSNRGGIANLYLKDTQSGSQEEPLFKPGVARFPSDWSRDGKYILYSEAGKTNWDLWTVTMDGERKATPFLQTPFRQVGGQFSPDGHWVAYASNESGKYEVFVRPFPPGPGKWKISSNGGQYPRWRDDGKEIFYLSADGKLMAVTVKARMGVQPVFEPEAPVALFEPRIAEIASGVNAFPYAVAADGKRFLMVTRTDDEETPLTVVVNWLGGLKK